MGQEYIDMDNCMSICEGNQIYRLQSDIWHYEYRIAQKDGDYANESSESEYGSLGVEAREKSNGSKESDD